MTKISSQLTFFYKKIFPLLFIGGCIFFLFTALTSPESIKNDSSLPVWVFPLFMFGILTMLFIKFLHPLADEVYEDGYNIWIKRGKIEIKIPFENIQNINHEKSSKPNRVTLSCRNVTQLGNEISFLPISGFYSHKFTDFDVYLKDLIDRIDQKRSKK